ncbi:RNA polymerase II subunit A C-terminal domain phosphatase [Copidosoma floridanum]|uniref:RNA polymerase II subunit A C-terminal domain phosphatase n=1 Tax=Copidosoma floridanum TaxID=29053 RepID=UPI0006C9922C|nr:RNA polymerase II subunit A C-terminal domain phosphatase [Copidosoma floridanum]XP_023245759.1 RNA polymerase II subunit A C-terminal domain phosphatase [Copidosoma floridanum]
MSSFEVHFPKEDQPSRIKKWKVSEGTMVTAGRILLLYQDVATGKIEKKLRATQLGRVVKHLVKENETVHTGQPVALVEGCKHPTVIKDLCAECGVDLREELKANPNKSLVSQANVPMIHSVPELKVTAELAEKIGRQDKERLLKHKQLVLLVDLDQTIVHTTNDNVPANLEDVYHFQLYGVNSPWYHTRLRPHTRHFLSEISKLYELHICTFGARQYAHMIASLLDSDGKLFSHRILSRDECFDSQSKTANLKALFPCGVDMVCIIDDRDDVWQGCANLVQVKPYNYFLHTGDINVPPGLERQEDHITPKPATEYLPKDLPQNEILNEDQNGKGSNNTGFNTTEVSTNPKELTAERSELRREYETATKMKTNKDNESVEKEDCSEKSSIQENKSESGEKLRNTQETKEEEKCKQADEESQLKNHDTDDHDDYLLYLEDILKRIHSEFYAENENENVRTKTLREIIPKVRSRVLQGLYLTFSGLVPNNQKLHQSRAYKVARIFGAQVTQDLNEKTTHLVAIQPGTLKVRDAKKQGRVKIVNPDWLWTCAERWEHVDERLYPLKEVPLHKAREFRKPPPHCSTPEHVEESDPKTEGNFASSINPLMVFSKEEIATMGREVDEDMSDLEDDDDFGSESESNTQESSQKRPYGSDNDSDSNNDVYGYTPNEPKRRRNESDNESNVSSDEERGRKCKKRCLNEDDDDDEEDDPVTRFRRGEDVSDDVDYGDNSQDSVCDLEADDMEEEREWNAMGAALEREFLSN